MKLSATLFATILFFSISMSNEATAQDWANLGYYKEANKKLSAPLANEKRIVFLGNSITESWSHFYPEFFADRPYINRGISGQTSPQMLVRFKQDVIDLKPKVVVLLVGTNDIAGNTGPMTLDEIMNNIIAMAELGRTNGISVILSSVLPAYDYPWRTGLQPNIKIPKLNEMIKTYAEKNGFVYLDYFTLMATKDNALIEKYTYDGVHPNKTGYEFMAPMAEKAIAKALTTDHKAGWKKEIEQMEQAFNDLAAKKGIQYAFLEFAADDAVLMRNNTITKGKNALSTYFKNSPPARKDERLIWKPDFIDVSDAGDLAYTYGSFTYSYTNDKGEKVENKGVFHTVWKRQADGSWKYVWD